MRRQSERQNASGAARANVSGPTEVFHIYKMLGALRRWQGGLANVSKFLI